MKESSSNASVQQAFEEVYQDERWGNGIGSGEGADPKLTAPYRNLLQEFINKKGIKSVVDLGCGDWQFTQLIDWSGINYTGVDVVPSLINELNQRFGSENVCFVHGNLLTCSLPSADLLLCKDVLQHLSNEMIQQFLPRLRCFKYAILTNDRRQYHLASWRNLWNLRPVDITKPYSDIPAGGYRPVRLREAPFNLEARVIKTIKMWHSNGMHEKEVLFWENKELA